MIDPTKKYRPYEGKEVLFNDIVNGMQEGVWYGPGGSEAVFWDADGRCYRRVVTLESFRSGDLIEVPEEVTVVRDVILWDAAENRVITTIPGDASSGDTFLGRVRFTHNGKELLKCEIVK